MHLKKINLTTEFLIGLTPKGKIKQIPHEPCSTSFFAAFVKTLQILRQGHPCESFVTISTENYYNLHKHVQPTYQKIPV